MINNSTYTRKLICNLCYHTHKMLRYQTTASHVRFCHQSSGSDVNDEILIEKFGKITTIAINRPEKRNCVNRITANKLTQAIHEFESDDSAYVGILYGKGGNFCAGFDLEELSNIDENTDVTNCEPGIGPMGPTRSFIKKPLIAAISGYAVAGGLELALLCDMRVVEETARLGVLCRRFGVPLIDGGTVRLPALIGLSRALDLILTGRIITGQEAHDFGLCNMLVACGTGLGQAMNLAGSLVKFPQECLLADRKSVYNSVFSAGSLQEALEFEKTNAENVINKESIEGAKKFVSGIGRHGRFTGLSNISYDFK